MIHSIPKQGLTEKVGFLQFIKTGILQMIPVPPFHYNLSSGKAVMLLLFYAEKFKNSLFQKKKSSTC